MLLVAGVCILALFSLTGKGMGSTAQGSKTDGQCSGPKGSPVSELHLEQSRCLRGWSDRNQKEDPGHRNNDLSLHLYGQSGHSIAFRDPDSGSKWHISPANYKSKQLGGKFFCASLVGTEMSCE